MRRSILLLIALAFGCTETPAHNTVSRAAISPHEPDPAPVTGLAALATTHEASRNIFAFREAPPAVVVEHHPQRQPQPATPAVVTLPQNPVPVEPEFGYRCLGTFGPTHHRFAVFANTDGIINTSIGDVVGRSEFVLREIGIESVLVEAKAGALTRRIEIGR
jgi:hypothetical protein